MARESNKMTANEKTIIPVTLCGMLLQRPVMFEPSQSWHAIT
jgi:hypothetical protein